VNIIIPAYKPDMKLINTAEELVREGCFDNIFVVNDGSGADYDNVFEALPASVKLLVHPQNRGKGRAMKTAFEAILKDYSGTGGAIIVDADGQHLLHDILRVKEKAEEFPEDVVIGSRKFTGKVPFRSKFGNTLTRWIFAVASGVKLYDTQTGLRYIPEAHFGEFIKLKGERYELEMNMLLHCAENGIKMHEIFIETVYLNDNESSHFNVIRDSFKIYAIIFKYIFSSFASFLLDFLLVYLFEWITHGMANEAAALTISVVAARVISATFNFALNKRVVFKNKDNVVVTFLKYACLAILVMLMNLGLMQLGVTVLGVPLFWTKLVTETLLFIFNYFVQRKVVFKPKK